MIGITPGSQSAYFEGTLVPNSQKAKDLYASFVAREKAGTAIGSSISFIYDREAIRTGSLLTSSEKEFGANLVFDKILEVEELSFVEYGAVQSADMSMFNAMSTTQIRNTLESKTSGYEDLADKAAKRIQSWNDELKSQMQEKAKRRIGSWR